MTQVVGIVKVVRTTRVVETEIEVGFVEVAGIAQVACLCHLRRIASNLLT